MNQCNNHSHNCIKELQNDHKRILDSLAELEAGVKENVKEEAVNNFLEFTKNFSEPHHHKEEEILFPKLEEKGIPNEGGPIGMMLYEHNLKRGYVEELQDALTKKDHAKIKEKSLAIISLMRDHIWKEDNILYPCAEETLTKEEMEEIGGKCSKRFGEVA